MLWSFLRQDDLAQLTAAERIALEDALRTTGGAGNQQIRRILDALPAPAWLPNSNQIRVSSPNPPSSTRIISIERCTTVHDALV
jgi:hypothetical protein